MAGGKGAEVPTHRNASELKSERRLEVLGEPFLRLIAHRDKNAEPAGTLELYSLGGATAVSIGRGADNDLSIPWDPRVSEAHCRQVCVGGRWLLEDDGLSRNGTFLDGLRISRRERLIDGSQIRCGRTMIVFRDPLGTAKARTLTDEEESPVPLTPAQRRVLVALCRQYLEEHEQASPATNVEIARGLFLSVDTVKGYVRELVHAFSLEALAPGQKRAALAHLAVRRGVVTRGDLS